MSAKEELEQMQRVLKNMARMVKMRAKKHGVGLVYEQDGKVITEKMEKTKVKK
jgi:hypothetical protein